MAPDLAMHAGRMPWVVGGPANELESARIPPFSDEDRSDERDLLRCNARIAPPPRGPARVRIRNAALRSRQPGGRFRRLVAEAGVLGPLVFRHACGRVARGLHWAGCRFEYFEKCLCKSLLGVRVVRMA